MQEATNTEACSVKIQERERKREKKEPREKRRRSVQEQISEKYNSTLGKRYFCCHADYFKHKFEVVNAFQIVSGGGGRNKELFFLKNTNDKVSNAHG